MTTTSLLRDAQSSLAEAHRCVIVAQNEPGHTPTEDSLICAVHALGAVVAMLVDVALELDGRVSESTKKEASNG